MPARLIGQTVRAKLGAEELVVLHGVEEVARHPRLTTKGGQHLVLDHYLEVLAGKPGALRGATALAQARQKGWFTATGARCKIAPTADRDRLITAEMVADGRTATTEADLVGRFHRFRRKRNRLPERGNGPGTRG